MPGYAAEQRKQRYQFGVRPRRANFVFDAIGSDRNMIHQHSLRGLCKDGPAAVQPPITCCTHGGQRSLVPGSGSLS